MADEAALADHNANYFEEVKQEATHLEQRFSDRDTMHEEIEQIVTMTQADDIEQDKHTKLTLSPDSGNKVWGAMRLLTSTEPVFSIPGDQNQGRAAESSSKMEKLAKIMWLAAGKVAGGPLENDAVMSALTFAEVHIAVRSAQVAWELVENDGDVPEWEKQRIKAVRDQTPYTFEIMPPREAYALRDRWGLAAYLHTYKQKARELKGDWPGVNFDHKPNDDVTVKDWYDGEYRIVWEAGNADKPFYMRKHGLPFIPIVWQVTEGSRIFEDLQQQIRPFLYAVWKSGLHKRQNLAMTALYTNIFALSSFATFKHVAPANNPTKEINVRMSSTGSVIDLEPGEEFEPMLTKGAIDPQLLEAYQMAERKVAESTIYDQALGEPLGSNAPFSMVALLHQAGRLPLANPQKLTGWALAGAMEIAFKWARHNAEEDDDAELQAYHQGETAKLRLGDVPEQFSFECQLDIDLPQDVLHQANAANQLQDVVSNRWIRENLLKIGDSESMDEEIWSETTAQFLVNQMIQNMQRQQQEEAAAEQQAAAEAAAAAQGGGEQGGGGRQAPEGGRGGITSEQAAQGVARQTPLPPQERGNNA